MAIGGHPQKTETSNAAEMIGALNVLHFWGPLHTLDTTVGNLGLYSHIKLWNEILSAGDLPGLEINVVGLIAATISFKAFETRVLTSSVACLWRHMDISTLQCLGDSCET